jgi:hypothetical protein
MKKLILALIWLTFSFSYSQNENVKKTEVDVNSLIKGTLFYAENTEKKPNLVILIAGSGPTDRNGNQKATGENNSLKFLAESITDQKTSVFSYDKRILQQLKMGTVDEKSARFDDLLTDACDVFNYFKSQNTYGKIYFAGHSEGSLVGMVASNTAKANGFISLAGPGRPIDVVLAEQIAKNASILEEDSKVIIAALKRGETVKITNPFLTSLFRESVQPYLISWMKYNPQEEIQKLVDYYQDLLLDTIILPISVESKIGKEKLIDNGFVNGYIKDGMRDTQYENAVYILFKPENLDKFRVFLDGEYERTKSIIDELQ